LADRDAVGTAVSLITGANGTGKSTLLGELARSFGALATGKEHPDKRNNPRASLLFRAEELHYSVGQDRFTAWFENREIIGITKNGVAAKSMIMPARVIALTISPFDKFPLPSATEREAEASHISQRYVYSGVRRAGGRAGVMSLLYNALDNLAQPRGASRRRSNGLSRVFKFLGYAPRIIFGYRARPGTNTLWSAKNSDAIAKVLGQLSLSYVGIGTRLRRLFVLEGRLGEISHAVEVVAEGFGNSTQLRLEASVDIDAVRSHDDELLPALGLLRSAGLLELTSVYTFRADSLADRVSLVDASSGELSILTNFLSLAATIEDGSLILAPRGQRRDLRTTS